MTLMFIIAVVSFFVYVAFFAPLPIVIAVGAALILYWAYLGIKLLIS